MRAEAFEELFELHFDAIYAYLARRLGPDLARDLASETFTRAFAARELLLRGEGVNGLRRASKPTPALEALASVARATYDCDVKTPTEESK